MRADNLQLKLSAFIVTPEIYNDSKMKPKMRSSSKIKVRRPPPKRRTVVKVIKKKIKVNASRIKSSGVLKDPVASTEVPAGKAKITKKPPVASKAPVAPKATASNATLNKKLDKSKTKPKVVPKNIPLNKKSPKDVKTDAKDIDPPTNLPPFVGKTTRARLIEASARLETPSKPAINTKTNKESTKRNAATPVTKMTKPNVRATKKPTVARKSAKKRPAKSGLKKVAKSKKTTPETVDEMKIPNVLPTEKPSEIPEKESMAKPKCVPENKPAKPTNSTPTPPEPDPKLDELVASQAETIAKLVKEASKNLSKGSMKRKSIGVSKHRSKPTSGTKKIEPKGKKPCKAIVPEFQENSNLIEEKVLQVEVPLASGEPKNELKIKIAEEVCDEPKIDEKSLKKEQIAEIDSDDITLDVLSFNISDMKESKIEPQVVKDKVKVETSESENDKSNMNLEQRKPPSVCDATKRPIIDKVKASKVALIKKKLIKGIKERKALSPEAEQRRRSKLFGFWNSPKRHRVASLNALAKVHCLYENESRGAFLEMVKPKRVHVAASMKGKIKQKEEEKIPDSDPPTPPTRTLRSGPGMRGVGKHWDMHNASSSSSSEESSSSVDTSVPNLSKILVPPPSYKQKQIIMKKTPPPPKPKKPPPAPQPKKRRKPTENIVMDLKDMVVRKRMASLNATAILAASYSPEKRSGLDGSDDETESEEADDDDDEDDDVVSDEKRRDYEPPVSVKDDDDRKVISNKKKMAVIVNQDTDVTITGVYVNSTTRSTHLHEGYCSIAGMQYRISATSHTQTNATAVSTETLQLHSAPTTEQVPRESSDSINEENQSHENPPNSNKGQNDETETESTSTEKTLPETSHTELKDIKKRKNQEIDKRMDAAYNLLKLASEKPEKDESSLYTDLLCKKIRDLQANTRAYAMLEIDSFIYSLKRHESNLNLSQPSHDQFTHSNIQQHHTQTAPGDSKSSQLHPNIQNFLSTRPPTVIQNLPYPQSSADFRHLTQAQQRFNRSNHQYSPHLQPFPVDQDSCHPSSHSSPLGQDYSHSNPFLIHQDSQDSQSSPVHQHSTHSQPFSSNQDNSFSQSSLMQEDSKHSYPYLVHQHSTSSQSSPVYQVYSHSQPFLDDQNSHHSASSPVQQHSLPAQLSLVPQYSNHSQPSYFHLDSATHQNSQSFSVDPDNSLSQSLLVQQDSEQSESSPLHQHSTSSHPSPVCQVYSHSQPFLADQDSQQAQSSPVQQYSPHAPPSLVLQFSTHSHLFLFHRDSPVRQQSTSSQLSSVHQDNSHPQSCLVEDSEHSQPSPDHQHSTHSQPSSVDQFYSHSQPFLADQDSQHTPLSPVQRRSTRSQVSLVPQYSTPSPISPVDPELSQSQTFLIHQDSQRAQSSPAQQHAAHSPASPVNQKYYLSQSFLGLHASKQLGAAPVQENSNYSQLTVPTFALNMTRQTLKEYFETQNFD